MATPTTAEIEKVVRKVLDEELGDDSAAVLKGIQRVTKLLTEQVIPKLPEDSEQAEPGTGNGAPSVAKPPVMRRRPTKPAPGKPEEPEIPEEEEDEDGRPTGDIPTGVVEAFEELYNSLSADQAKALTSLFTAISSQPAEGGATGPTLAVTDALVNLAERKPDEFQATVDALTPYVVEEADGTFSISASKRVIKTVDRDSYDALVESLDKANQVLRGATLGAVGARGRIPWGPIWRLVKKAGKWVWYKVHLCTANIVRNQDKYPGDIGDKEWIAAAAIDCARAMR